MIFAEESAPDLFEQLLALLAAIVMPVWNDLIQLIPLVLVVGVVVYLLFTLWQWRNDGSGRRDHADHPGRGDDVHLHDPAAGLARALIARPHRAAHDLR